MKLIELSQGRLAIVDDEDFHWLLQWKWYYWRVKGRKTGYAKRNVRSESKRKLVPMQVAVMQRHRLWESGREVDHINTCGCDNRKENLRLATRNEQGANVGLKTSNTSGVTGVNWHKQTDKWQARIKINGKQTHLGLCVNLDEAIEIRRQAEIKHRGEFQHDPTNVCPLGPTGQCPDCAARLGESNEP